MKILVKNDENIKQTMFWFDYIRDVYPSLMNDIVLVDLSHSGDIRKWASGQGDFTYVYFEEEVTCGSAFDQVIDALEIKEDIMITDCFHIPLMGSCDRLLDAVRKNRDALAVGPLSNTFGWKQHIKWKDANEALDWSEAGSDKRAEEVLMLECGVILFSEKVIYGRDTFDIEAEDIDNMIKEKCIREFLKHFRMYVVKSAGFWDTRGNGHIVAGINRYDLLKKRFNIHYFNVNGNEWLTELLSECEDLNDDICVLEVGCDCGGNLFGIRQLFKNARLYGTDINEGALRFAAEFAEVKINNIEEHNLDFETDGFDIIVFADVLEHLNDPLGTLLYCRKLLKNRGRIAASIPNLMNIEVIRQLLDGNFTYSDIGLLDRTHIHMFTYNEIIKMFVKDAGYTIEKLAMNSTPNANDDKLIGELVKLGRAEEFMYRAYQYQVVARL